MTREKVYLDVCALLRPYDDQSQARIRLETEAVNIIIANVRSGRLALVSSPVHRMEICVSDPEDGNAAVNELLNRFSEEIEPSESIRQRTEFWRGKGLGIADAAHLAFAESVEADFVSCDDVFIKKARKSGCALVWLGSPVAYCEKEDLR